MPTVPTKFAWFFGYHVFDVSRARAIAAPKPLLTLTTVNVADLLEGGSPDRDAVKLADVKDACILARVPIGDGRERYVLIDGHATAAKCLAKGQAVRLRVLSLRESHQCRIAAESSGDWPEPEPI